MHGGAACGRRYAEQERQFHGYTHHHTAQVYYRDHVGSASCRGQGGDARHPENGSRLKVCELRTVPTRDIWSTGTDARPLARFERAIGRITFTENRTGRSYAHTARNVYECGDKHRQVSRPPQANRFSLFFGRSTSAYAQQKGCRVPKAGADSPVERHGLQQGHPVVPHLVVGHHRQQSARFRQPQGVAVPSTAVSSLPRAAYPRLMGATDGCFVPHIIVAPLALATLETIHASADGYLPLDAILTTDAFV